MSFSRARNADVTPSRLRDYTRVTLPALPPGHQWYADSNSDGTVRKLRVQNRDQDVLATAHVSTTWKWAVRRQARRLVKTAFAPRFGDQHQVREPEAGEWF